MRPRESKVKCKDRSACPHIHTSGDVNEDAEISGMSATIDAGSQGKGVEVPHKCKHMASPLLHPRYTPREAHSTRPAGSSHATAASDPGDHGTERNCQRPSANPTSAGSGAMASS